MIKNTLFWVKNLKYVHLPAKFVDNNTIREYNEIIQAIKSDINIKLTYPINRNVSKFGGEVLYSIIRKSKPKTVIETGIANGLSTRLILSALNKNEQGKLISVDINNDVGGFLKGFDTSRWVCKIGKPREGFLSALSMVDGLDIFMHDSAHSYENMLFEYREAFKKLTQYGIVMSDDVNANSAFIEFSKEIHATPYIIPSRWKSFGILYNGR